MGRIINLDGLVNDEIANYAPNRLPCYLADKHIQYASGFGHSSTVAFHLAPLADYSTPVRIPLGPGADAEFFRIDPRSESEPCPNVLLVPPFDRPLMERILYLTGAISASPAAC